MPMPTVARIMLAVAVRSSALMADGTVVSSPGAHDALENMLSHGLAEGFEGAHDQGSVEHMVQDHPKSKTDAVVFGDAGEYLPDGWANDVEDLTFGRDARHKLQTDEDAEVVEVEENAPDAAAIVCTVIALLTVISAIFLWYFTIQAVRAKELASGALNRAQT